MGRGVKGRSQGTKPNNGQQIHEKTHDVSSNEENANASFYWSKHEQQWDALIPIRMGNYVKSDHGNVGKMKRGRNPTRRTEGYKLLWLCRAIWTHPHSWKCARSLICKFKSYKCPEETLVHVHKRASLRMLIVCNRHKTSPKNGNNPRLIWRRMEKRTALCSDIAAPYGI